MRERAKRERERETGGVREGGREGETVGLRWGTSWRVEPASDEASHLGGERLANARESCEQQEAR